MTCHITTERISSPPTAPAAPLSTAQLNFLALHAASHPPHMWQWLFQETLLRAHSSKASATIWRDDLERLVEMGLMARSHGASVVVTALGRELVQQEQKETAK